MKQNLSYAEKLRDPRWQKMRLKIMERDKFSCTCCGDNQSTLNVHHAYYERGKMPWEHPAETLFTLCEPCHVDAEEYKRRISLTVCNQKAQEITMTAEAMLRHDKINSFGFDLAHLSWSYDDAMSDPKNENKRRHIQKIIFLLCRDLNRFADEIMNNIKQD